MGVLDYVNSETFEYRFNEGYMTRYGFDWRLVFFETFFRQDQVGATEEDVRPYVNILKDLCKRENTHNVYGSGRKIQKKLCQTNSKIRIAMKRDIYSAVSKKYSRKQDGGRQRV